MQYFSSQALGKEVERWQHFFRLRATGGQIREGTSMEERDFFDERPEQRTHTMTCPHCGQPGEYQIGWLVRRKKAQLGRNADERDRARFAKAQSYMVRTDDLVGCKNIRCRKRFDVAGIQSVAFL
jgi:hypothetical protein